MTVYLVIAEHWEDYEILGIHQSLAGALAEAHPSQKWSEMHESGCHVLDLPYGQAITITSYEVKA